jgi:predicted DNA-binding transcriptional regulator AlpA
MITGWKEITRHTGFSRNTIKRLMKEEKFPLQYIASKPTTTEQAIQDWFKKRLQKTAKAVN